MKAYWNYLRREEDKDDFSIWNLEIEERDIYVISINQGHKRIITSLIIKIK